MLWANKYRGIWAGIDKIWQTISVIASTSCLFLMLSEIFARFIVKKPLMGIEEVICMIAFWAYFMGAVHGSYEGSHIKAELIELFTKNINTQKKIKILADSLTVIITCIVTVWGLEYFLWGLHKAETSPFLLIPRVYSQSAISLGLLVMAIYAITDLISDIISLRNNKCKNYRERNIS